MSNENKSPAAISTLSRRSVVRSIITLAAGGAVAKMVTPGSAAASADAACADDGRLSPVSREPLALDVTPRTLRTGDFLLTDQYNARVYLVRDRKILPFIDVDTWGRSHVWDAIATPDRKTVYLSMSGLRGPTLDYVGVKGLALIVELDPRSGKVLRSFSSVNDKGWPHHQEFIDTTGMVLTSDGKRLLVNDFIGFAHRGMILEFDLTKDGEVSVFRDGLMEPAGLSADGPDHVLVGNARMPGGSELGGQVVRVNVNTGTKEVLFNVNRTTGALIGAIRLADGTLVGSISDWPDQLKSEVIRIDGKTKHKTLIQPDLAFFSAQMAPDPEEGFWVAESVSRTLLHMNTDGKVLERINVDDCEAAPRAATQPLGRAFDTLESIRLVA